MLRTVLSLSLLAVLSGCGTTGGDAKAVVDRSASWDSFGAPLASGAAAPAASAPAASVEVVAFESLVAAPAAYDGKAVLVHGAKIQSVCKRKGCWMVLGAEPQPLRVTFKDYGFFVPLDCEGREVVLEGVFEVKTVPAAELKHYLEDAGKHEEAAKITSDKQELRLVASGVRLSK